MWSLCVCLIFVYVSLVLMHKVFLCVTTLFSCGTCAVTLISISEKDMFYSYSRCIVFSQLLSYYYKVLLLIITFVTLPSAGRISPTLCCILNLPYFSSVYNNIFIWNSLLQYTTRLWGPHTRNALPQALTSGHKTRTGLTCSSPTSAPSYHHYHAVPLPSN